MVHVRTAGRWRIRADHRWRAPQSRERTPEGFGDSFPVDQQGKLCSSGDMSDHVYEKIEVVGSSKMSIEDAVNNAVAKVSESGKTLRWLEVVETRGHVEGNQVAHWQVTIRVGARMD